MTLPCLILTIYATTCYYLDFCWCVFLHSPGYMYVDTVSFHRASHNHTTTTTYFFLRVLLSQSAQRTLASTSVGVVSPLRTRQSCLIKRRVLSTTKSYLEVFLSVPKIFKTVVLRTHKRLSHRQENQTPSRRCEYSFFFFFSLLYLHLVCLPQVW